MGRPLVLLLVLSGLGFAPGIAIGQEFIRGDANGDGLISIVDGLFALDVLFGDEESTCRSALDVNDDGRIDVADPVYNLLYQFTGGDEPPAPFPNCGTDPTDDDLGCEQSIASCSVGGPIDGLTQSEILAFNRGRVVMDKRFTPNEGLGPFYNTTSCSGCHDKPFSGGSSPIYRNFFIVQIGDPGPGQYDPPGLPGPVMPAYNGLDRIRPVIPADPFGPSDDPVRVSQRNAPPFFGVGLFEFISDETILENADPNDSDGDDISGRFNTDGEGNIGRFGYKLQANFIEAFIRGAANNQMGVTTNPVDGSDGVVNLSMLQQGAGFDVPTEDDDDVPDPEMSEDDLSDLIVFNRFLRPPPRLALSDDAEAGEDLFADTGCTDCHIPSLESSKGDVNAYTDLLLHFMGDELADDIHMGTPQISTIDGFTTEKEFRTQPLWGLRHHAPYLHDGRADTIHDAIVAHGGEGEGARDAYLDLTEDEQQQIIAFLEAL